MQIEKASNGDIEPAYDHVIPAPVFYDERLSGDDKLLYGLIRALCRKEGYCWATNDYLAGKFKVDARTIRRRVQSLIIAGHVYVVISKDEGNVRRIYLGTNLSLPMDKSVHTPTDKSVPHNKERKKMKKYDEETPPPQRRNGSTLSPNETVLGAIACGAGKYKSAKDRKRMREATLVQLIAIWQRAWKERFPNAPLPIWTKKDTGALLGYRKRFRDNGRKDFEEYMEWSVLNWRTITKLSYKRPDSVPELPSVRWWVLRASVFENMFSRRKEAELDSSKTTDERMIAALIAEGYDPEAAKREVEGELGITRRRNALQEQERRTREAARWLYGRLGQSYAEARAMARKVLEENPNATKETLEKLTDEQLTKYWKELEKGLGRYEDQPGAE